MFTVTFQQAQQAGHPHPERATRRRFISEADRDAWLANIRNRSTTAPRA